MLAKKYITFFPVTSVLLILLLTGCDFDDKNPDVADIPVTIRTDRFEKDLFNIHPDSVKEGINLLATKYGNFFNLYAYQITTLGSVDSLLMYQRFSAFIEDTSFRRVYYDCEKLFNDFNSEDSRLTNAFRYYYYYFPGKIIPRLVTIISGFSYPVVCDSFTLSISLDMYLGPGYSLYSTIEPPLPNYLRNRMHRDFIVCDAMKGWAASDYTIDETTARMMDFMIHQGRLLYFLDKVTPDEPDTIKTGYSSTQLDWCKANEKQIWSFFIDNNLLFSFDPNLMNKYVNDGPTTNGFPKESPGNIGQFIGWQIVKSYMKNHPDVSLQKLMEEKDLIKVYNESGYKPGK